MRFEFLNNFATQIAAPVAEPDTTIELSTGADLIAAALQDADAVALTDSQGNETKREVVYVTAVSAGVVTVERGQEGATPQTFNPGDGAEARLTAASLANMEQGLSGLVPASARGAIALGVEVTQEGEAFPRAQAVAEGALAFGADASATGTGSVALGSGFNASLTWNGDLILSQGAKANGTGAVAIGAGAQANTGRAVAIGSGSDSSGLASFALAGGGSYGTRTVAIGEGAQAYGDDTLALGEGAYTGGNKAFALFGYTTEDYSLSIGEGSNVSGSESVAVGRNAQVNAPAAIALGLGATVNAEGGTAVGRNTDVSSPKSSAFGDGATAQPPGVTVVGAGAAGRNVNVVAVGTASEGQGAYSVALGSYAVAGVSGGMAVNALSYLPAEYVHTAEYGAPPPTATRQAAMQVVVGTAALDLTDETGSVTVEMPPNTLFLPDTFDVVVVDADGAGGLPEIQIGPDGSSPAEYLAATPVTKTAVGGRETHTPLVTDGVTTLRVSVASAGTGTAYQVKIIVRGYVMEI
ncbi:MAG: hypothetical protein IKE45_01865 [Halomonas sp.]|nr:hypothetical protein [Halomonas sp.]MBR2512764.1 hypothetical protein [Halomonas sp.]